MAFDSSVLDIDPAREADRICDAIRGQVARDLRRKGAVLGVSGGIDSSVTAALLVRALGPGRVLALLMPESESADESLSLGRELADHLGIEAVVENIGPILQAAECYRRRDDHIRTVIPEYGDGYRCKVVYPNVLEADGFRLHSIVARAPDGTETSARLPADAYRGIIAANNFKQRVRKMMEYYHADRLQYAVAGTPNRLEYDQGFFVKLGDGAADVKPIAHLYKTQVYRLAEFLGVPETIRSRPPTTDTFSLSQSQEEFFFSLPYAQLDLAMCALDAGVSAGEAAPALGLTEEQVERVFVDIRAKRAATAYQHAPALLVEPVR